MRTLARPATERGARLTLAHSTPLRIAAAQSTSIAGDAVGNARAHLGFIHRAASRGVQLLVFPELSLTGYEPALHARGVLEPGHPALALLGQAAADAGMSVVVGAPALPCQPGALPAIGAWLLSPDGSTTLYRKRYLHPGEDTFASAGDADASVHDIAGEPVALAVCADATRPAHANAASLAGAHLYATGALISARGIDEESAQLQGYAATHGFAVLLANHAGASGGYVSAGRSAVWQPGGACVVAAEGAGDCLVMAQRDAAGCWTGEVIRWSDGA